MTVSTGIAPALGKWPSLLEKPYFVKQEEKKKENLPLHKVKQ